MKCLIISGGRNTILETLRSTRQVKCILIAEGQRKAPAVAANLQEAGRRHIPVEIVPRYRLDQLSQEVVHQGYLAVVKACKYARFEQILALAMCKNEDSFILILDAIQDVNNLGSLLRSGKTKEMHGVIIPLYKGAEVHATVIKTSAGATELLLIAKETNLTRMIEFLKKQRLHQERKST